jgi:hypothetical protein
MSTYKCRVPTSGLTTISRFTITVVDMNGLDDDALDEVHEALYGIDEPLYAAVACAIGALGEFQISVTEG